MSINDFEKAIVAVLRPAGFVRFKSRREWRRERDGFLEEVDLQKFRWEPLLTVNYAMRHEAARLRVERVAGAAAAGPSFSISGRIGGFLGPMSLSWNADDMAGPPEVQHLICTRLLPYFENMQTMGPYIAELTKYYGGRWTMVPQRLELAVLLHKTGAVSRARELLADPPTNIGLEKQAGITALQQDLFGGDAEPAVTPA